MISANYRLKKSAIDQVYKKGRAIRQRFLLVRILKNNQPFSRFAVVISKTISPKATQRNRLKRKTFAIIEKLGPGHILREGSDIIISFKGTAKEAEIEPTLSKIFPALK